MSNNLSRTEVAASQNQKEVTINDSDGVLDAAVTETVTVFVDTSNTYTLSADEWTQNCIFIVDESSGDPATSDVTLNVPATTRGLFVALNNTAFNLTVQVSGQIETPPTIGSTDIALLASDGSDVRQPAGGAGGGTFITLTDAPSSYSGEAGKVPIVNSGEGALVFQERAYDFGMAFGSEPSINTVIQRVQISRDITIPANMASSTGSVNTNPSSQYDIDVQDDAVSIGTISISTGGAFTFTTTSGTLKNVAAGSVITFVAPGSADGSIDGVAVGILATEDA